MMSTHGSGTRLASIRTRVRVASARVGDLVLRRSLQLAPTEAQRTFFVTLLVGAGCGLLAVSFHGAILGAERLLIARAQAAPGMLGVVLTLIFPTLGGLLAGILLTWGFAAAAGSGIPQIKAGYAVKAERIRLRDGAAKFGITTLQIGAGASLGREGPTVHMCAALSSALGRSFALSPRSVRRLLPVGAAAGVAAAFNAPVAAVTFTVEEIVGALDQTVLSGVVVAAALAAVIEHTLLGAHPIFELTHTITAPTLGAFPLYAALGMLAGLTSVGFNRGLLRLRRSFLDASVPAWCKPAIGGFVTGACAVAGLLIVHSGGVAGGGYWQLSEALNGLLPLTTLLLLGLLKFVATLFSYSSGGSGGIFAPSLFIGAMLGGSLGWLGQGAIGPDQIRDFALVGMGATFAGVVRAPITSVLIVFEMTGGYALVLPLMIANTLAYLIARRFEPRNLYDALLEQDGIHLPHLHAGRLEGLSVERAMTHDVRVLLATQTAADAFGMSEQHSFSAYPVVDENGVCLGMLNRARLRRVMAEGGGDRLVGSLVWLREYVHPGDAVLRAVVRMDALGVRQLPVVNEDVHTLCGVISMSDVLHAQAAAAAGDWVEPPSSEQLPEQRSALDDRQA